MIRLITASLLFLLSLLSILHAPTSGLWKLAIAVTEFPFVFLISALLCFLFIPASAYRTSSLVVFILTSILFSSPIFRAANVSRDLRAQLDEAFGIGHDAQSPIGFFRLFKIHFSAKKGYRSMTYFNNGGKELKLDFYPSLSSQKSPVVIVIHGGSWSSGTSQQLPELNEALAARGFHVASINYRLAPAALFPAPLEDLKAALAFLKWQAQKLHIDTSCFVLLGRSAGGQIALTAAYTFKDPDIRGVIAYYAPADMVWGYSLPCNPLILDSRKVMEDYLGGTYAQATTNFHNSSPLEWVSPGSPPTLLIHGARDEMVAWEHSRRLDEKLQQNHVPHYLLTLPWATHGCDFNINGPSGQLSSYAVFRFLERVAGTGDKHS